MAWKSAKPRVAVVGAGVVGLSTAVCIQENLQSVEVTIVADKFLEQTLSYGAGGLFRPEINIGPEPDIIQKWSQDSYDRFLRMAVSDEANESGMQLVSGFHMNSYSREKLNNTVLDKIIPNIRSMTEDEHKMFPSKYKYGVFWTTIITDPRYYLPWLTKKFNSAGGKSIHKHVDKLDELADYDVVVNCSGLNAKFLVDDWKVTPIRGQTIKVKAPWIKHFYYGDDAYIIPGRDYVTLGGVKDYGEWNINIKELDRSSIWQRCTELVPSLSRAEVAFEWVGLRPQRQPVRVEKEITGGPKGQVKVVHNYGHGGHGITLSWGTAVHATRLTKQFLENENSVSNILSKL